MPRESRLHISELSADARQLESQQVIPDLRGMLVWNPEGTRLYIGSQFPSSIQALPVDSAGDTPQPEPVLDEQQLGGSNQQLWEFGVGKDGRIVYRLMDRTIWDADPELLMILNWPPAMPGKAGGG